MTQHYPHTPTPGEEGWFVDPENSKYARLWNGEEWTSHKIYIGELKQSEPIAFRPENAPGPIYKRKLPKPAMGQIPAPGQPPVTGMGVRGGDGIFLILLRKIFGDHRDPRQR